MLFDRVLVVVSEPVPGMEDEFNEWYNTVHVPEALTIPGFRAARRFKVADIPENEGHRFVGSYLALYDLDVDPETAGRNLIRAREEGRLTPLSPAVATEKLVRPFYSAFTDWFYAADNDARY
jgi:hypothetical protein